MPAKKLTEKRLDIIPLGSAARRQNTERRRFKLASLQADGTCAHSYDTDWTEEKALRLPVWLAGQPDVIRTAAELSALLRLANTELGHGNATPAGRERANRASRVGVGRWHGRLDQGELMGPGYVVVRGLVDPKDCATLRKESQHQFSLHQQGQLSALRKVHAASSGGAATLHSLARAALQDTLSAEARDAWDRAIKRVSEHAGHGDLSSDEALNVCADGMARQEWHQDSTASLAYIVALSDEAAPTQFVQVRELWIDVMLTPKAARMEFLRRAWDAAATSTVGSAGSVGSASSLHAGDVLFFYTQRIHRAPPPPPAGSPRYTLFGAFCRQGKTEGAPLLADTWERIWGAFSN